MALPVLGSAAVIAAGSAAPTLGVEWVLKRRPLQWLGKLSYSLYLWHWPILVIVAEHLGKTPSVGVNLLWMLVALGISIVSYAIIENPVRHAKVWQRHRINSLILGAALTGLSVTILSVELHVHG